MPVPLKSRRAAEASCESQSRDQRNCQPGATSTTTQQVVVLRGQGDGPGGPRSAAARVQQQSCGSGNGDRTSQQKFGRVEGRASGGWAEVGGGLTRLDFWRQLGPSTSERTGHRPRANLVRKQWRAVSMSALSGSLVLHRCLIFMKRSAGGSVKRWPSPRSVGRSSGRLAMPGGQACLAHSPVQKTTWCQASRLQIWQYWRASDQVRSI
jgi:hypothetical protein